MNYKKAIIALCVLSVLAVPAFSKQSKFDQRKEKRAVKEGDKKGEEKKKYFQKEEEKIDHVVTEEVYLEIEIQDFYGKDDNLVGRIVIGVFGDIAPMTALNFVSLAKGFKKRGVLYKYAGTEIHRVVMDFIIQGGDVTHSNGEGGMSLYGPMFDDENYTVSHRSPGIVSMANYGRNSNASQFFILLQRSRWLNRRHVAFGKVIKGMDILRKIGSIPSSPKGTTYKKIRISDSGVIGITSKYELTEDQMDSETDIE